MDSVTDKGGNAFFSFTAGRQANIESSKVTQFRYSDHSRRVSY